MHNFQKSKILLLLPIILMGCSKEPSLQVQIEGLNLNEKQSVEYFLNAKEPTKQFVEWCKKNMPSSSEDKASEVLSHNCEHAALSTMLSPEKLEGSRKYTGY